MSLNDRIAEINRINTQLLIKNDRIGRNARQPDQRVRKMMTPVENEIIGDFEAEFPNVFEVETGEVDENGVPIKKYQKYVMPDSTPELEEEPPAIKNEEELRKSLDAEFSYYSITIADLDKQIGNAKKEKKVLDDAVNNGEITPEQHKNALEEGAQHIEFLKRQRASVVTKLARVRGKRDNLATEIADRNAEILAIRKRNQMKVEEYRKNLDFMNKGAFNTQKGENETESDYLERLRQTAMNEDPEDELNTAISMINKKFRLKMRELITDVAKIEQVANGLDDFGMVNNKYKLLKIWNLVKNKFLISYGADNKKVSANDILKFMQLFLQESESGVPTAIEKEVKMPMSEGQVESLVYSNIPDENTFLITNMETDKHLYLKPVLVSERAGHNDTYALLYSFTGLKNSFKQFFDGYKSGIPFDRTMAFGESGATNKKLKSTDEIYNNTGITKQQLLKVFKQNTPELSANNVCKILIKDYNLTPLRLTDTEVIKKPYTLTKKGAEVGVQYGYGIHAENIPKIVPFGDVLIYLQKLYYENVLSVRNKQMKVIAGFRTMKVSEQFVKLIMNMMKGINPTHSDLETLKTGERQVYDRLIILAHLNKNVVHQKDNTVKDLKKRLKLLESEIEIGNNSPLIKKEIYGILHALKNFKVITKTQVDNYLKQI